MKDNEIHFYGDKHHFDKRWLLLIPAIILAAALGYFCYWYMTRGEEPVTTETTDTPTEIESPAVTDTTLISTLTTTKVKDKLVILDTTINDIPITILIPLNSKPQLRRGYETIRDTASLTLCFAAADAGRHDKIIGAFVFQGELLNSGLTKKGFCAIVNDTVTIGMAENSPLFEKSINNGGYFFRQRALVDSGRIVENELRGQFLCRALCQKNGHTCIVLSRKLCSLYDFSQILTDIGITQAISLQSAVSAKGWYRTADGHTKLLGDWSSRKYPKAANYIVWSL